MVDWGNKIKLVVSELWEDVSNIGLINQSFKKKTQVWRMFMYKKLKLTNWNNLHLGVLRFGIIIFRAYEIGKLFMGVLRFGVIISGGEIFIFSL